LVRRLRVAFLKFAGRRSQTTGLTQAEFVRSIHICPSTRRSANRSSPPAGRKSSFGDVTIYGTLNIDATIPEDTLVSIVCYFVAGVPASMPPGSGLSRTSLGPGRCARQGQAPRPAHRDTASSEQGLVSDQAGNDLRARSRAIGGERFHATGRLQERQRRLTVEKVGRWRQPRNGALSNAPNCRGSLW
jgi:hypothetical protein